jgi:phage head maturation protease
MSISLCGYAVTRGDEYRIAPGKLESFAPYVFTNWLSTAGRSIHLRVRHAENWCQLARRSDGTLRVWEDDTGLAFEARVEPGSKAWLDLSYTVASKKLCRCSWCDHGGFRFSDTMPPRACPQLIFVGREFCGFSRR